MMRQRESYASRAWVEIDLGALRRNGALLAERAGVPLIPMVKADGYGLGAVPVACALEALDPWGFGVATVAEGEELRDAGIRRRVVIFTPLHPDELAAARAAELTPTLGNAESIRAWTAHADRTAGWHLAIDTGMSRQGVPWRELEELGDLLQHHPPEGAFTHFHSAERNDGSLDRQEERFAQAVERLPRRPRFLHTENSAALERRGPSRWDLARPGIFLYGVGQGPGAQVSPEPVAAVRARVVELRWIDDGETVSYGATYRAVGRRRIATLAIGHGDGYRQSLSNRGTVLVRGRRAPVAGIVSMDMTMIDVTDVPCELGDVATLLGRDGEESLDIATVARTADVSPYELLIGLRLRLARHYLEGR